MSAEDPSSGTAVPVPLLAVVTLCALLLTSGAHPDSAAVPSGGDDDGMPILRRAATAEGEVSYTAVREVFGPREPEDDRSRLRVVNQPGEGVALAPVDEEGRTFVVRASSALEALDERLLHTLEGTYAVAAAGATELDGRPAGLVEATRANGTVAGRFWVDSGTGLLVGRTVYDEAGTVAFSTRLTELELGDGHWPDDTSGDAPWGDALTADERDELREGGWRMPEHLAWNLRLVDARSTHYGRHRVVHSVYSDGLSQVSVFAQRGKLATEHPSTLRHGYVGTGTGGSGVSTQHDTIFGGDAGQYQSMWQADGFVFTVLADSPAALASSAVTALPEPEGTGFWARVQRGLSRLGFV